MEVIIPKYHEDKGYDQATDSRLEILRQAETLLKMYGIESVIKFYPFYAHHSSQNEPGCCELCYGEFNEFRRPRWRKPGWTKVVPYKNVHTLLEGVKRLTTRKSVPVE